MTPLRVLVADDRPIFRAGVQGLLKDFPDIRVVAEATTGRQAVELTRRYKPDVVLMDLNMPEMGGIAATRAIKAEQPETTVLALTVSEAEEDVVEMVTAGASALSVALWMRARTSLRFGRYALSGAALGAAMAMKFSSALLLPALLAAELVATVGESSTPRWRRFAGLAVEAGTAAGFFLAAEGLVIGTAE